MDIRVLGRVILVKLDEDEWLVNKPDLIQIPDQYIGGLRKRATTGVVSAIGADCKYGLKVGQRIKFPRLEDRQKYVENGSDYRFVKEEEVEALIYD